MIRSYRNHFAKLTAICLAMMIALCVPAFADDAVTPPDAATPPAATEPAAPAPADPAPADPAPVTPDPPAPADPVTEDSTPSTGPTGATGSDDPADPVAEDTGTPTTTTEPTTPSAPQAETPVVETPAATPPAADRTVTDNSNKRERTTANKGGTATSDLLNQVAASAPAETPAPANTISGSTNRAADQIERNAESGVAASLVVTRIVSEIPSWILWALAALAALALAGLALFVRERLRRRSAEQDAMVDELTGISNRKAFDRRLDLEWRRAARYGRSLGLMVMDLDGFKQVNDLKGHAAGDKVLRAVGQSLDGRMRDTDLVARIGGDEFAIICPETGINELMTIRRQLIDQVTRDLTDSVGLSIGVAEYVPNDDDATSILARADESMYRVKRGDATALPA